MHRLNIFLEHIYEAAQQRGTTFESMLSEARKMGYTGLECDLWRLSDCVNVRNLFESCGLNVASIYSMYDFLRDTPEKSLDGMKRHLETAAYFGAEKVLAIPGFFQPGDDREAGFAKFAEQLSVMCELAAEYGIMVTLEDFDDSADTGNFAFVLEDPAEAYERLKPYVAHAHLKDRSREASRRSADGSNSKPDLSEAEMYPCETGGGYVGVEKLVKRMLADGYTGDFSVEHFGAVDQAEYMRRSAENVKRWISEVTK